MHDGLDQRISNSIETYFYARNKELWFMCCKPPKIKPKFNSIVLPTLTLTDNSSPNLSYVFNALPKSLELFPTKLINSKIAINSQKGI